MARHRTPLPRRTHHEPALRTHHRGTPRHQGGYAFKTRVLTPSQPDTQTFTRAGNYTTRGDTTNCAAASRPDLLHSSLRRGFRLPGHLLPFGRATRAVPEVGGSWRHQAAASHVATRLAFDGGSTRRTRTADLRSRESRAVSTSGRAWFPTRREGLSRRMCSKPCPRCSGDGGPRTA